MKIVCTNTESCGHKEQILDNDSFSESVSTCEICGSIALLYENSHTPIFKKEYNDFDLDILIQSMYLITNLEKREEKNETKKYNIDAPKKEQ